MDLSTVPILAPHVSALRALGYDSVEHFMGAVALASPQLSAYLGVDVTVLLAALPAAMLTPLALPSGPSSFTLGVALDRIPLLSMAPVRLSAAVVGPLPAAVDHVARQPTICDQADRGTCVAFATVAAFEDYLTTRGAPASLSEEYMFWDCKQHDGIPAVDGTWLGIAYPLLHSNGSCDASVWQYNPTPTPSNLGHNPPPPGTAASAAGHRAPAPAQLAVSAIDDLKAALTADRCVSCSVQVFDTSFFAPAVITSGDITMPVPAEPSTGGHAMCLVGYRDLPGRPELGGGRFLIRNSWGTRWGTANPSGAGYGTIPYAYVAAFGAEAWYIA